MSNKEIRIECEGAAEMPYTDLVEFQGNLKTLSRDRYEKLKGRILEDGFSEPITVWKGENKIGNGHQRLRVVKTMVETEGYSCPPLPISWVNAKDEKEFARKVLALAGNYGEVDEQGLYEFMEEWDFTPEELAETFQLAGINTGKFIDNFYSDNIVDGIDIDGEPEIANPDEEMPEGVSTSQVRMVQLFFDVETADGFNEQIEELKAYYGTTNVTDTVLNTVKECYDAHNKATRAKA